MSTRDPWSDRKINVGIGVLLLGACASGWVVSAGHVNPDNLFDIALAMETFNLHSEIGCIALLAALLTSVPPSRTTTLAWVERSAGVLVGVSIVLAVVTPVLRRAELPYVLPLVGALQILVGALSTHAAVRRFRDVGWTPISLTVGSAGLAAIVSGVRIAVLPASSSRMAFELLVVASIAMSCEPTRDDVTERPPLLPFVALVALIVVRGVASSRDEYGRMLLSSSLSLIGLLIGVAIVRVAWRSMPSSMVSAYATRCGRFAVSLFAASICLRALLATLTSDIHLHETMFVVGALHLETFVVLLTWLALWLRDRVPRPHATRTLGLGIVCTGVGAHLTCWAMIVLGSMGMPMRFTRYLEQFERLHRLVALGATLLVVGLAITLASAERRREPEPIAVDVFA